MSENVFDSVSFDLALVWACAVRVLMHSPGVGVYISATCKFLDVTELSRPHLRKGAKNLGENRAMFRHAVSNVQSLFPRGHVSRQSAVDGERCNSSPIFIFQQRRRGEPFAVGDKDRCLVYLQLTQW